MVCMSLGALLMIYPTASHGSIDYTDTLEIVTFVRGCEE